MLILGLVISLAFVPAVLALADQLHVTLSGVGRHGVACATAGMAIAIAVFYVGPWRQALGVSVFTWASVDWGIPAIVIATAFMAANVYLPRWIGYRSQKQKDLAQTVRYLPLWQRCFFLVSAAITEEVLYRGYAVGFGSHILGSLWVAAALSVIAFTTAHYWHGAAQLPSVFVLGVGLTLLFVATRNLWLCICVHALLNGSSLAKPTPYAQCADQASGGAGYQLGQPDANPLRGFAPVTSGVRHGKRRPTVWKMTKAKSNNHASRRGYTLWRYVGHSWRRICIGRMKRRSMAREATGSCSAAGACLHFGRCRTYGAVPQLLYIPALRDLMMQWVTGWQLR